MNELADRMHENRIDERHRGYVTSLLCRGKQKIIEEQGTRGEQEWSVCVLGAGPCNDLDLNRLAAEFDRVMLIDLDEETLLRGIRTQGFSGEDHSVRIRGGMDVTGIFARLTNLPDGKTPPEEDLSGLIRQAESAIWQDLPEKCDVIASTCLLSQLVMTVVERVDDQHRQFLDLVKAIRHRHIQLMIDQLKPGGIGLLIFDFVSSETIPGLAALSEESLLAAVSKAIENQNFFHGMNPRAIAHLLQTGFASQLLWQKLVDPWVWRVKDRDYAVAAIAFRKKEAGS